MSINFSIHPVPEQHSLPDVGQVSSVALIAINESGKVLVTRHKERGRGYDLPGGHLELGESVMDALQREVYEEVGANFEEASLIAIITSDSNDEKYKGKSMLIFTAKIFKLIERWEPSGDVTGRTFLEVDVFLEGYLRDKDGMLQLLNLAIERLGEMKKSR